MKIDGVDYEWKEGPSSAPVWRLVGQTVTSFELRDRLTLRMSLNSGDFLEFIVAEDRFESFIADFGVHNEKRVMEIY